MKNYNIDFTDQIWQIFDDEKSESIVIATKSKDHNQSSFYYINLSSGIKNLLQIPFPETIQWNIAKVYQQRIVFQSAVASNQPTQQYILIYDISSQKILFENYQRAIQTIVQQGIISYLLKIEPRKFELLAFDKNEILTDLSIDSIPTEHLKLPEKDQVGNLFLQHHSYYIQASWTKCFTIQVLKNDYKIYEWSDKKSINNSPENDYFMMIHDYLIILKEKNTIEIIELKA